MGHLCMDQPQLKQAAPRRLRRTSRCALLPTRTAAPPSPSLDLAIDLSKQVPCSGGLWLFLLFRG